jgi:glycosyltransferase involved in cell wall biosynthesis
MKISVITVCYNAENTIEDTLKSVRNQTYGNIEHIVIDGKSTDSTLMHVTSGERYIAKIISEEDDGIYDAMNKGLELATGDIIAFLNADDYYKDVYILSSIAHKMEAENLDILYGDVEYFSRENKERAIRRYNSGKFSPNKLSWGLMPAHPALFFRRSILGRIDGFRSDYRIAGDFEFIVRLFKCKDLKFAYLPKVFVRMQMGGISTSGLRATLMLNREILRACRDNAIPTSWPRLLLRYPFKLLELLKK